MKISAKILSFLFFICNCSVLANNLFESSSYQSLTADKRANKVGDTVTIIVLENAQAKSSSGSESGLGLSVSASGSSPNGSWPYGLGVSTDVQGDEVVRRNGYIKAQITALVVSKDNNGNLGISGKQVISIDGESQSIEIAGKVRESDISSNNTVISSRLFEANITFSGVDQNDNDSSLIARFIDWLGL